MPILTHGNRGHRPTRHALVPVPGKLWLRRKRRRVCVAVAAAAVLVASCVHISERTIGVGAKHMDSTAERVSAVRSLISLSRMDLLYGDHYLRRAEALLQPLCTREQYARMRHDERRLPEISAELNRAVGNEDWDRVRSLAEEGRHVGQRVAAQAEILVIAERVYGPRWLEPDAQSLGLSGVVKGPRGLIDAARTSMAAALQQLAAVDSPWAEFYRARTDHLVNIQLVSHPSEGAVLDTEHLKRGLRHALQKGRFDEVRRLADTLAATPRDMNGEGPVGVRLPAPSEDWARRLAEPFSEAVRNGAAKLGLTCEHLAADESLNGYLSCFCAEHARFPVSPLEERHRQAEHDTCGHASPPELPAALQENLDLLMVHPFITSAGTRYLPWFGREAILVEAFSEGEGDAGSLVDALGLPRRLGLSRIQIEDASKTRGPEICADLGLDPLDFVVLCIPFDAYLRLAPKYGWGRRRCWTHFDGYQVLQHAHLRALVGGDSRYGGPYDLCSVERYYDPQQLLARFAIARRGRFTVRDFAGESS